MGLSEKVSHMADQMQQSVKTSLSVLLLTLFKLFSALFIGTTVSLIAQEIIGYEILSLIFVLLVVAGVVFKGIRPWSWGQVLLFDLFLVLVSLLMRMYILIAP